MTTFAYIGKGGVGKSTLAVETAYVLNQTAPTVVIGIDQQHNHSDIIRLNRYDLDHYEIRPVATEYVEFILDNTSLKSFKEYTSIIANDFIALLNLAEAIYRVQGKYQHIVIDFPPNHAGLNMVRFPDVLDNMVFKAVTLKERIKKMVTGKSEMLDKIDYLVEISDNLKKAVYSFQWLPLGIPTFLGLLETKKAYELLIQLGMSVHAIVCNMIQPMPLNHCHFCDDKFHKHTHFLSEFQDFSKQIEKTLIQIPFTFSESLMREIIVKELRL